MIAENGQIMPEISKNQQKRTYFWENIHLGAIMGENSHKNGFFGRKNVIYGHFWSKKHKNLIFGIKINSSCPAKINFRTKSQAGYLYNT